MVRGGLQRAVAFGVGNILSLAGAVVLLRYLSVEDFGSYGTVIALVGVVYGITDAGLTITGSRELAVRADAEARRRLLAHLLTLRILLTGLGVLGAVAFAVLADYPGGLVTGTLLAGTGIFLASVQAAMLLPLSVELRNGRIALNEVLRQAVLVAAFGVLVAVGAGLVAFFAAQILLGVVLLAVTPWLVGRHHLVLPRFSRTEMAALVAIAVPVAIGSVLGALYQRMLVILMSLLSDDPTEVGYFVTSTRVVEVLAALPSLLVSVIIPVLSVAGRDDDRRMRYITTRLTETMALGGIAVALVIAFAAEPIVVLLGEAEYAGAGPVLQIQAVALVTIFVATAGGSALVGLGRVRALVVASGSGLLALLASAAVLIPALEARGAALAAVVADLVLCLTVYALLRGSGPAGSLEVGRLLRIGAAAALGLGAGLVPGLSPVAGAVVAGAVFVCAALALRAVPPELLDLVTRRYRRSA